MLNGYKTYIVAIGMILYQVLGYLLYGTPMDIQTGLEALGLAALRKGVAGAKAKK